MQVDLKNVWKQQGDQLYASCARAVIGFAERAAAELKPEGLSKLLQATGTALSAVEGGTEPDELEIAVEAPGLEPALAALIVDLASLTDFGAQELGKLLIEVAADTSLKRRDAAALATSIQAMDLRGSAELEDASNVKAMIAMRAIRSGVEAVDLSGVRKALKAVNLISITKATSEVVSTASDRFFDALRAAVTASVEAVRNKGGKIELASNELSHSYLVQVDGFEPHEWTIENDLIRRHRSDVEYAMRRLDKLHALCGSDASIEKFAQNCASVGMFLPESRDGRLATYLREGRDGFAAFLAWYDRSPERDHRCSTLRDKLREMCDHPALVGRELGGIVISQWLEETRGGRIARRNGVHCLVRPDARAPEAATP